MQETWVWSSDGEDPLEKNIATHFSTLALEISWTEEPGGLPSMELQRVSHEWSDFFVNVYNNLLFTDKESELGTEQLERLFKASGPRKGVL